jgi:hypothetical protein
LTPTIFISYHADIPQFLSYASSHFFADDLVVIIAGNIGSKYSTQCLDLERKTKICFDQLEVYCTLAKQPVNYDKTVALWSDSVIGGPEFVIDRKDRSIKWSKGFRYLGYEICPKLGSSKMIFSTKLKIKQRITRIISFRLLGMFSCAVRKAVFNAHVLPLFTCLFPIYPLFSEHFYFTCIKRIRYCASWNDELVAFAFDERSVRDRCVAFWEKFLIHIADIEDDQLLFERANLNFWRDLRLKREITIRGIRP